MPRTARDQSATGIYHVMIRGINRQDIFDAPEDYRKFIETLAELTAWVDMPMSERYGCIDIDERRVIPDVEIREAVINACGLRSISDFQLLTLERKKVLFKRLCVRSMSGQDNSPELRA